MLKLYPVIRSKPVSHPPSPHLPPHIMLTPFPGNLFPSLPKLSVTDLPRRHHTTTKPLLLQHANHMNIPSRSDGIRWPHQTTRIYESHHLNMHTTQQQHNEQTALT